MAQATAYSAVKAALVTRLKARPGLEGVHVSYQAPVKIPDVRSINGSWESIHLDDAEGTFADVVFCGADLTFDETYTQMLVIQVLRPESLGTQQACDKRVEELLYEVHADIAAQTDWDFAALDLDVFDYLFFTPSTQSWETGFLEGTQGHAAKCTLGIGVQARRSFP